MYSQFVSYVGFCSKEEDHIYNGATQQVAYPILQIPFLLMPCPLKEPGHQQVWYQPPNRNIPSPASRLLRRPRAFKIMIMGSSQCLSSITQGMSKIERYETWRNEAWASFETHTVCSTTTMMESIKQCFWMSVIYTMFFYLYELLR